MPVAIVTGSSRGIGKAIALHLADDGFDVAVNDIAAQAAALEEVEADIVRKGRRAIRIEGDVSLEADVQALVAKTVEQLGELTVMVANAGIILPKSLFEASVDDWDKVMAVNARGVFLCYREAGRLPIPPVSYCPLSYKLEPGKQMVAQGKGGKIIGACSTAGYRPSPFGVAYSASKWAVRGLTQVAALELAKHDINVNAYCPGPVNTDMWTELDAVISRTTGLALGESYERMVQDRAALRRATTPEDIAGLVAFLASPASKNITGQSILCDGGGLFS